jgi:hypothetical protein
MSKSREIAETAPQQLTFDAFLAKLGTRDKVNVEKVLAAAETANKRHVEVWKRLASQLFTLSPHAVQTSGQQAVRFFLADGKYRLQCFALEDQQDGKICVYTNDILSVVLKKKLVVEDDETESDVPIYHPPKDEETRIGIESLNAGNSGNAPEHYKHMLGWNRKALRITIPTTATDKQVALVEAICGVARENTNPK